MDVIHQIGVHEMGGAALQGMRVPLYKAMELGFSVMSDIQSRDLLLEWKFAGSVRRKCEMVGDIDVVVVPYDVDEFCKWLTKHLGIQAKSRHRVFGLIDGVQIDFYLASQKDFGAQLLTWTGSVEFNMRLRHLAKVYGMKLNQYGLWVGDKCLSSASEEAIFERLRMNYVPAESRC